MKVREGLMVKKEDSSNIWMMRERGVKLELVSKRCKKSEDTEN